MKSQSQIVIPENQRKERDNKIIKRVIHRLNESFGHDQVNQDLTSIAITHALNNSKNKTVQEAAEIGVNLVKEHKNCSFNKSVVIA